VILARLTFALLGCFDLQGTLFNFAHTYLLRLEHTWLFFLIEIIERVNIEVSINIGVFVREVDHLWPSWHLGDGWRHLAYFAAIPSLMTLLLLGLLTRRMVLGILRLLLDRWQLLFLFLWSLLRLLMVRMLVL
jgi:hypothetical protein